MEILYKYAYAYCFHTQLVSITISSNMNQLSNRSVTLSTNQTIN